MLGDDTDRDRAEGDTIGEATSTRVVRRVSAATDTPPTELPPLFGVVDTDALDALAPPGGSGSCCLSFRFAQTDVYVSDGGEIQVTLDGDRD